MEQQPTTSAVTPVVSRLVLINALVFLVVSTVLTAPVVRESIYLVPADIASRPWTLFSYLFIESDLPQLALATLALGLFGPSVERKLGRGVFIGYYLVTGFGVTLLALMLDRLGTLPPVIGSWGAVLGLAIGYASVHSERTVPVFALPLTVRVKTLVWMMVGISLLGALVGGSQGVFHIADIGGVFAGSIFLRLRGIVPGPSSESAGSTQPVLLSPIRLRVEPAADRQAATAAHSARTAQEPAAPQLAAPATSEEEINRVLDKISAEGWQSLTQEEQRFLQDISRRKREDTDGEPA